MLSLVRGLGCLGTVLVFLLLVLGSITASHDKQWDCERPWPDLELFLPVLLHDPGRAQEWKELFLRTYLLFWPIERSKTKLLFLVDEEQRQHEGLKFLQETIQNHSTLAKYTRIGFNNPPPVYYGGGGHNRQQYLMFWADNFTESEFVGFVDTDCFFLTYVDREDVFEEEHDNGKSSSSSLSSTASSESKIVTTNDGNLMSFSINEPVKPGESSKSTPPPAKKMKPVVIGKSGDPHKKYNRDPLWQSITATTYDLLGVLEPMKCMSYFPVIVKTKHMKALREFLEQKYNLPFYEVFQKYILTRRYSQFNIFCAYLFHFHQDDYTWYANDLSPEWDFSNSVYGQLANRSAYTSQMRFPKPRIATHARYHAPPIVGAQHVNGMVDILQSGICFSPPFPKPLEWYPCNFFRTDEDYRVEVFEEMHRFEWSDFTQVVHHSVLKDAAFERYQRHKNCQHDYGNSENISHLMTQGMKLSEGTFIYTIETGRRIFYYANNTLRGFPNYDTFLAMGGGKKGSTMLTHRQFKNMAKGPDLPPIEGRRRRLRTTRKANEEDGFQV